jgi:hypothetical protein
MPTYPLGFHLNPLTNPWVKKLTQIHTLIEQKPTGFSGSGYPLISTLRSPLPAQLCLHLHLLYLRLNLRLCLSAYLVGAYSSGGSAFVCGTTSVRACLATYPSPASAAPASAPHSPPASPAALLLLIPAAWPVSPLPGGSAACSPALAYLFRH